MKGSKLLICPVISAGLYLFYKSGGDLDNFFHILVPHLIAMLSMVCVYMAWKAYWEGRMMDVMLLSAAAIGIALIDHLDAEDTWGRVKIFMYWTLPILMVESLNPAFRRWIRNKKYVCVLHVVCVCVVVNFVYGAILHEALGCEPVIPLAFGCVSALWSWILNFANGKAEKRNLKLLVWFVWMLLFAGLTVLLAVVWDNSCWIRFHLNLCAPFLLVMFPVICAWLRRTFCSKWTVKASVLYLLIVLAIAWADYGLRSVYSEAAGEVSIDRTLYYLLVGNAIGLSRFSLTEHRINRRETLICGLVFNMGMLLASPFRRGWSVMLRWLAERSTWAEMAAENNSLLQMTNEHGAWLLLVFVVLLLITCVTLWQLATKKVCMSDFARYLVLAFGIRMLLVIVEWFFKVPYCDLPAPFYGTGFFDIIILMFYVLESEEVRVEDLERKRGVT